MKTGHLTIFLGYKFYPTSKIILISQLLQNLHHFTNCFNSLLSGNCVHYVIYNLWVFQEGYTSANKYFSLHYFFSLLHMGYGSGGIFFPLCHSCTLLLIVFYYCRFSYFHMLTFRVVGDRKLKLQTENEILLSIELTDVH